MSKTSEKEPKTKFIKFIKEVEIAGAIVIPVIGKARKYVDSEGIIYAEIDYENELMNKAIDKELLPILEEATGINHFRSAHDNMPLSTGGILLPFRNSVRDRNFCFEFMKENKE